MSYCCGSLLFLGNSINKKADLDVILKKDDHICKRCLYTLEMSTMSRDRPRSQALHMQAVHVYCIIDLLH